MSPSSSTYNNLQLLATKFISSYNACSTATPTNLSPIDSVFSLRTKKCEQILLPSQTVQMPKMSNEEYRKFLEQIVVMGFEGMKMTTEKILVDPEQNLISIHAKTTGMTPVGEYTQEYAFWLEVVNDDENGQLRINKVEEFVDSKFNAEFQGNLMEWMKKEQELR